MSNQHGHTRCIKVEFFQAFSIETETETETETYLFNIKNK